uniref:TauD/TfdA family dioxygenase n=1 Tax=Escherichia coli TaxID=562 RepID=UPI0020230D22
MSERLSITPLGPYIGAQITGADLTRPLSDNQFEQLYHAVLRHQVVFLRDQAITPQQQRALAQRFGELHIHPVYPHAEGVDEIIVLDTHNDNPPDNDNWHTDVTFIQTPPAGALTFLAPPDDLLIFQRISQNRGNKLTQIITNR